MPAKPAARGEYIETETGNKISRRATILGPKHIILAGKCVIQHDVLVHGDLVTPRSTTPSSSSSSASIINKPAPAPALAVAVAESKESKPTAAAAETVSVHLGRYVFISPNVTLHPPSRLSTSSSASSGQQTQSLTYHPLRIGEHVFIGANTHVRAASIGSRVHVGSNCVLGNLCMVKDNVRIEDGTVLPANSVWASGSVLAGSPARVVGEVGEAWGMFEGGVGTGPALVGSRERWVAVGNRR